MFKVLKKMCPKSLTQLFTYKSEMSNYELQDIRYFLYHSHVPITWKEVSCLTGHTYGTLYQKKLGRASPSRALKVRSLLTLLRITYETTHYVKRFPLLLLLYLIFIISYSKYSNRNLFTNVYLINFYCCTHPSWKSA